MCEHSNEQILKYETNAAHWLAEGNEQKELGNDEKAKRFYEKSQYWHDLATKARGNG